MNKRDIVESGLVLYGLGYAVFACMNVSSQFIELRSSTGFENFPLLQMSGVLLLDAGFGIFVAIIAPWLARFIKIRDFSGLAFKGKIVMAGCVLGGVWLLVTTVPVLINNAYFLVKGTKHLDDIPLHMWLVRSALLCALGFFLVSKAEVIARLFSREKTQ